MVFRNEENSNQTALSLRFDVRIFRKEHFPCSVVHFILSDSSPSVQEMASLKLRKKNYLYYELSGGINS